MLATHSLGRGQPYASSPWLVSTPLGHAGSVTATHWPTDVVVDAVPRIVYWMSGQGTFVESKRPTAESVYVLSDSLAGKVQ